MAFIVKKTINGKDYFYLNESKRVDGKVKSKTIAYLGKERKLAEKKAGEIISKLEQKKVLKKDEFKKEIIVNNCMDKSENSIGNKKSSLNSINYLDEKIKNINRISSNKGIFFQTGNIYGGKSGFFTYGHLGKQLKINWENLWRKNILLLNENFHEIQSNNILPQEVFLASGHIKNFNDPLTECKKCCFRFRADQFLEEKGVEDSEGLSCIEIDKKINDLNLRCPKCSGELSETKQFNMMFSINVGFEGEKAYLSPETAQGAYISFLEEFKSTREKLPLGLAIIDKAYRNEISPRQIFFRLREFTQAELQIFFDPDELDKHEDWDIVKNKKLIIKLPNEELKEISCSDLNKNLGIQKFYLFYASKVQDFYLNIMKIPKEKFRFRKLSDDEKAFYNKIHLDIEIYLETLGGFKEVAGIHYRSDHDLSGHKKISGKKFEVFSNGKKIIPHILELSFGVDRNIWTLLDIFYSNDIEGGCFKFPFSVSPIKAGIFPIVKNNERIIKLSREIYNLLREDFNIFYDSSGSIGRRYSRSDEIGTPFCITIDEESLKNKDVTIRYSKNKKQIRVEISELKNYFKNLIEEKIIF